MSTYAIGDIQGCFKELVRLLDKINFDESNDRLWFVGDLVNRGPDSLQALNFIMDLGESAITVLGNHDLHLLVITEGLAEPGKSDTLAAIINSPEKRKLIDWVRQQPLMHHDKELNFSMIHAGLPPQWEIEQALELSSEVSNMLNSDNYLSFLDVMYGNNPKLWDENLTGNDRIRFIVNCFTRMRYINDKGELEFSEKGAPGSQGDHLSPWFTIDDRKTKHDKIVFGHWSTVHLGIIKNFKSYNVYPIDTGCLWDGELTALRLEDETLFSVPAE
ncbi:MAG: bis(5'-nucleosyl)-tetraphosphatase (symmetrical) [Gammaproteobacteria bacterium]|jgi:bis(5'-nucleosyl)-tetraphosphatase (symmetrical)